MDSGDGTQPTELFSASPNAGIGLPSWLRLSGYITGNLAMEYTEYRVRRVSRFIHFEDLFYRKRSLNVPKDQSKN